MTFEINLREFDLTDVLQLLLHAKKTGVVRVTGSMPGEIYFSDGIAVHAADATCTGVDALFNMSAVASGTASFEPGVPAPENTISEDAGRLLETVEKRRVEFQSIREKLPPTNSIWAKTTKEPESAVALRRTDWQVLAMIDGRRRLSNVINDSKLGSFEVMKSIVWLREKGLIYEPEQAARTMSRLVNYLNCFLQDFSKNGLIWFRRWAASTEQGMRIGRAIAIDEDTMEVRVVSELDARDIDIFITSFEEIVKTEGPKIYGKLLFRKKFDEFMSRLSAAA